MMDINITNTTKKTATLTVEEMTFFLARAIELHTNEKVKKIDFDLEEVWESDGQAAGNGYDTSDIVLTGCKITFE